MSPSKILVVEDEEDLRFLVASKLRAAGYEVHEAGNGAEGFEKARQVLPELIITDVVMPTANGNYLLKEVRNSTWGKSLPFIVVTAHVKMKDYFEMMNVNFIEKPFEMAQLSEMVTKIFDNPAAHHSAGGSTKDTAEIIVRDMALDSAKSQKIGDEDPAARFGGENKTGGQRILRSASAVKPKILILETDPQILKTLQNLLAENYRIETRTSTRGFIADAKNLTPHLVAIRNLPGQIDAKVIASALKDSPELRTVPIIIYQSLGQFEGADHRFVLNSAGKEFLQKMADLLK